jgi:hypothetical protein
MTGAGLSLCWWEWALIVAALVMTVANLALHVAMFLANRGKYDR